MNNLEQLKQEYKDKKPEIVARLNEFKKVPKEQHFYELSFCILTPQSQAKKCWEAIEDLKKENFKNKNFSPTSFLKTKTRFHNNKSKYLLELKSKIKEIEKTQKQIKDGNQLREYLTKNVKGFGLKEASHYLRNIGYTDLAILDRHILKNLQKYQVIDQIPKNLNKNNYFEIESKFQQFSQKIQIPMDHLDLLFWSQENGEIFK